MDVVYLLSSSLQPDLFRYVGCTESPQRRLNCHAVAYTLVGIWAYWERMCGGQILMRSVQSYGDRSAARTTEAELIHALSGEHLLNQESWSASQRKAGVPAGVVETYKQLLHMGTAMARNGDDNHGSHCIYLSKLLASEHSSLRLDRVGASLQRGLAICSKVHPSTLPIIASVDALQSEYIGHTPGCLRL